MSYRMFILQTLLIKQGAKMYQSLLSKVLFKLSAHCRCRVISGNAAQPYLERYHLLNLPFGIQVYLHRFIASDPGKGLHNHPWKAALSFILSGQYIETRLNPSDTSLPAHKRKVKAGFFNYINGNIYHRIDLDKNQNVWSLFIHTQKQPHWGFIDHTNKKFAYQDHNNLVTNHNNPKWWKTADKPRHYPLMRQPLN